MQFPKHIVKRIFRSSGVLLMAAAMFFSAEKSTAQHIAHVQPDALGPGMTIAMEVLAPAKDSGAFGADGIYLPSSKILLLNAADSQLVVFGPVVVSWNGRVLQVPVMAKASATTGIIRFQIVTGKKKSDETAFEISHPLPKISISGDASLGDIFTPFSFNDSGNTIVADEIEFLGGDFTSIGHFTFSKGDSNISLSGNPHYHPVTLLSRGPIHLRFAELSVSGDSLNGGSGGGGGGAGFAGTGGAGYTGGGSDSDYASGNVGSGANSTDTSGGASSTGVLGGKSSFIAPNIDQGGGGGTGCPYGSSGINGGGNDTSKSGGFGGGSAGGETVGIEYGGGGGAFATNGEKGAGVGNNGGKNYGGRFLLPMQGGSGGGAGNHVSDLDSTAGSGGGGGGALTLISFDTVSLINSFIVANGSKGTSGINSVDAGGGGGAGGGIILSGRYGITLNNTSVSANGGSPGLGGTGAEQTSKGGAGGKGRIRMDGEIHVLDSNSLVVGVKSSGPTLDIPAVRLNGPFSLVSGTAGDSASLTDSIRIYYRNHHSSWSFFDTVRFKSNGKFRWQAFLPMGHDSSLFVTAMAQVKNPTHGFANFEPERLISHLSSGIIPVVATPHLVLRQDTFIFGCYKIGDPCVSANFFFSNLGEDSLHIKSITVSNANFTLGSKPTDMGYYTSDSLTITYCPKKVGKDTAVITFTSNDSIRTAILIGCGIDKDTRITLKPSKLDFGKVKVGKCDTLEFTAHSVGKDSALLSVSGLDHTPFSIIQPLRDTLLAPKDSVQIFVSFCPGDTGEFHWSFILTEKRDSVIVSGIGTKTIRLLQEDKIRQGNRLCIGDCDTLSINFSSVGNDTVTITNITGATFDPQILPIKIPPQTDTTFTVRYCASEKGDTSLLITYNSDADAPSTTIIHYYGVHPAFAYDSAIHFDPLCLGSSDSLPFVIRRVGNDSITIVFAKLVSGNPFSMSGNTPPGKDSFKIQLHFTPVQRGQFNDTLQIVLREKPCLDSFLIIPITGTALNSDLIFSKTSISFGAIDTNSCRDDSVIITNPCNNTGTLTIPGVAPPFFIKSPSANTLSFGAQESKTIIYSYCPKLISIDSAKQIFTLISGATLSVTLKGTGQPTIDSPFVRFKLDNVSPTAGSEFSYLVSVDSISPGTNIKSLQGLLQYDPTLVEPLSMKGIIWNIFNNSETVPGTYKFSANNKDSLTRSPFATVQMLALYGRHDTTSVFLDSVSVSSYASTEVISGFIRVVQCGNLQRNIIVAGDYALGNPTPNPANGSLSFPVLLGNDGILHIRMYNPGGMTSLDKSFSLKRGENTIVLDVSTLSSGVYYLSVDSWGWRDGKTLVIQK